MKFAVLGAALLVLFAAHAQTPSTAAMDTQALIQADMQFAQASAAKGVEGWLSFFAQDAVIFPVRGPVVKGLPAIRKHYADTGFTPAGLTWKPDGAEISSSGDIGYTYGYWEYNGTGSKGQKVVERGKYVTGWRKQADGSWKVVFDFGSADAEPEKKS